MYKPFNLKLFYQNMENEHLLDINTESIPPSSSSSPKDQSPASFSRNLIGRLSISSQGTETAIPKTQRANTSNPGVVSSLQKASQAIKRELIDPLHQILKEKCEASSKCEFLRSCLAHNTLPKGATPIVPLKILNTPSDLENKLNDILHDCGWQFTLTLINYHQSQIAEFELLAEETITNGNQIVLPEFIAEVPDTPERIENAIQELLCEISLTSRRLRKRPPISTTPRASKKAKPDEKKPLAKNGNILLGEPSTSKNILPPKEDSSKKEAKTRATLETPKTKKEKPSKKVINTKLEKAKIFKTY